MLATSIPTTVGQQPWLAPVIRHPQVPVPVPVHPLENFRCQLWKRLIDHLCGLWVRRWLLISLVSWWIWFIDYLAESEMYSRGMCRSHFAYRCQPTRKTKDHTVCPICILAVSRNKSFYFTDKFNHEDLTHNTRVFGGVWWGCGRRKASKGIWGGMVSIVCESCLIGEAWSFSHFPPKLPSHHLSYCIVLCSSQRTNNWKG